MYSCVLGKSIVCRHIHVHVNVCWVSASCTCTCVHMYTRCATLHTCINMYMYIIPDIHVYMYTMLIPNTHVRVYTIRTHCSYPPHVYIHENTYIAHYTYRAKVVAEEGRKPRPNQTTPAMHKHTHMMKRTLGCPALITGTVGYQLSPHTHTQHTTASKLRTAHHTCTCTLSVATKSGPSAELICKAASILHFRVTDHICTLCTMFTTTYRMADTYLLVVIHVLYTVQVHGCQGFPTKLCL